MCFLANSTQEKSIRPLLKFVDDLVLELSEPFRQLLAANLVGYYTVNPAVLERFEELSKMEIDEESRQIPRSDADKVLRKLELLDQSILVGPGQLLADNESREQVLIGEVYRIVAEAGHLFSQKIEHDWGIDGEIEFKDAVGEASGQRVYLQLKSGDSYLRRRKRDGKEIFTIKDPRHAEYWQAHRYPVLLVIRNSSGLIRWMNVTEYLQRHGATIKQIEFEGEPFTAESIREIPSRFSLTSLC